MHNAYNITDLVKSVQKGSPLPANFADLDEASQRRLRREAEAEGTTAEALYKVILAQAEQDAADDFNADAIANEAHRR